MFSYWTKKKIIFEAINNKLSSPHTLNTYKMMKKNNENIFKSREGKKIVQLSCIMNEKNKQLS